MTRIVAIALAASLATLVSAQAPVQNPGAPGKISGRVTIADSGKPTRSATMHLIRWDGPRGAQAYLKTGPDGRFEFTGLIAGDYQLSAAGEGLLTLDFGQRLPSEPGRRIVLHDAETFDKADIALPRASAIEGTLLDEFGEPAPGIVIQASRQQFVAGRYRLMPIGGPGQGRPTDDKGRFRIFGLQPGDYFLVAMAGAFADQNDTGGFSVTLYPGTADAGSAQPVHVDLGREVKGLSFAMVATPTVRVAGTVLDEAGQPARATVLLAPADRTGTSIFAMARGASDPTGRFSFRNVPAGAYTLQVFGQSATGALGQAPFGFLPITVGNRDLGELVVPIRPDATLRGRIIFDGDPAKQPKPGDLFITAAPIEFDSSPVVGGGPPRQTIRPDFTFEVGNMSGHRIIRPQLNGPWTLKSITVAGMDVTDTAVDFTKGSVDAVEITFTDRVSSVTGDVRDADGKLVSSCTVVLFSQDSAKWVFPSRFIAVARPNQTSQFRTVLPPGPYLALAVESIDPTEAQDPRALERLRGLATPFSLAEGESHALNLKLTKR